MVYLNYNNLDEETQQRLLTNSKEDIVCKFCNELKKYAIENHISYDKLLDEEAMRNSYQYVFNI